MVVVTDAQTGYQTVTLTPSQTCVDTSTLGNETCPGGPLCSISEDVNNYLREITGEDFTAKDFRTWAGTVLAAMALNAVGAFETKKQAKANIKDAISAVAKYLATRRRSAGNVTFTRQCWRVISMEKQSKG